MSWALALALGLCVGCGARSTRVEGDGPDADSDSDVEPCVQGGADAVDLLVMVDNSNSMTEEQASLVSIFPSVVRMLVERSGDESYVASLHVGVISSDMGTAGYPIVTCSDAAAGDDGVLQHEPGYGVEGCADAYPPFLTVEEASLSSFASDFACIATLGTSGCGFEQQLYAVEKALTVHSQPGGANAGFLRADALLAILIVTDENDCSAADPTIFSDNDALGGNHFRCINNPELLRPTADLATSVLGVKPGRPDRIVVGGILGVPPELAGLDFQAILDHPTMQDQVDFSPEGGGTRLVPSCNTPDMGIAFAPRRILEFIRDMDAEGAHGAVGTICEPDFSPAAEAFRALIQGALLPGC